MFTPISPNIDWHNHIKWIWTKQAFCPAFQQVHLSAISSDIGLENEYKDKNLWVELQSLCLDFGPQKFLIIHKTWVGMEPIPSLLFRVKARKQYALFWLTSCV